MEFLTEDPLIFGAVAMVAGLLLGMLLTGLVGRFFGSNAEAGRQAKQAQEALDSYKADVTAHFEKTAELFGNLTDSYRAVYEHMAASAQGLCDTDEVRQRIAASAPQALPREVPAAPPGAAAQADPTDETAPGSDSTADKPDDGEKKP